MEGTLASGEGREGWRSWDPEGYLSSLSPLTSPLSACHPIKGIKDIGSLLHPVWNMPAGEVGGKQWTLNEVEGYLRDPKPFK